MDRDLLDLHLKHLFDHGVNLTQRVITLVGEIDDSMFQKLDYGLSELERYGRSAVTIRLKSGGGFVYSALAIIGRIKASRVSKVSIEGYGQIMSAATLILAAGDERKISHLAWTMWHETIMSFDENETFRASQLKDELRVEAKQHDKWCEVMASYTKKPKEFWLSKGVEKDLYLTPEELLELGVVDSVI